MPDELVGAGSGDACNVEAHARVLEHRQVPHFEDVPEVTGVRRGAGVRLVPALVAGPAGELRERRATVGVRLPPDLLGRGELGVRDQADLPPDELGHSGAPLTDRKSVVWERGAGSEGAAWG